MSGAAPTLGYAGRVDGLGAKAKQSAATRAALIEAARNLFADQGYAAVSIEQIIGAAGVSRGALYHHFRDKAELFRAVAEELEQRIAERIWEGVSHETRPEKQLAAGMEAGLDAFLDPPTQRVLFLDGPAVLGSEEWQPDASRPSTQALRAGLQHAIDIGQLERLPLDELTQMLIGALTAAGLLIAQADDRDRARKNVGRTMERLLEGLHRR